DVGFIFPSPSLSTSALERAYFTTSSLHVNRPYARLRRGPTTTSPPLALLPPLRVMTQVGHFACSHPPDSGVAIRARLPHTAQPCRVLRSLGSITSSDSGTLLALASRLPR
ncbi:hypothetical protein CF328_g8547, partial [Tilletia controversa]